MKADKIGGVAKAGAAEGFEQLSRTGGGGAAELAFHHRQLIETAHRFSVASFRKLRPVLLVGSGLASAP